MAAAARVRSAPADEAGGSSRSCEGLHRAKAFRHHTQHQQNAGVNMNKRLLSAAIGIALCALAAPANARPHVNDDDDDGSRTTRQRHYDPDRSYGRNDDD